MRTNTQIIPLDRHLRIAFQFAVVSVLIILRILLIFSRRHMSANYSHFLPSNEDFDTVLKNKTDRIILVLDRVVDFFNIQCCLRTADSMGVQNVWIVLNTTKMKNRDIPTSHFKGTDLWITVRFFSSHEELLVALKADGRDMWVTTLSPEAVPLEAPDVSSGWLGDTDDAGVGLLLDEEDDMDVEHEAHVGVLEVPEKLAIVMGREADGVDPVLISAAQKQVYLPMVGFSESYNVSVATGLVLHRLFALCPLARGQRYSLDKTESSWIHSPPVSAPVETCTSGAYSEENNTWLTSANTLPLAHTCVVEDGKQVQITYADVAPLPDTVLSAAWRRERERVRVVAQQHKEQSGCEVGGAVAVVSEQIWALAQGAHLGPDSGKGLWRAQKLRLHDTSDDMPSNMNAGANGKTPLYRIMVDPGIHKTSKQHGAKTQENDGTQTSDVRESSITESQLATEAEKLAGPDGKLSRIVRLCYVYSLLRWKWLCELKNKSQGDVDALEAEIAPLRSYMYEGGAVSMRQMRTLTETLRQVVSIEQEIAQQVFANTTEPHTSTVASASTGTGTATGRETGVSDSDTGSAAATSSDGASGSAAPAREKVSRSTDDIPKVFPHWCLQPLKLWSMLQTLTLAQMAMSYVRIVEGELLLLCLIQGLQVRVGDEWLVGTSLSRGCFNKYQQTLKRYVAALQKARNGHQAKAEGPASGLAEEESASRKRKLDSENASIGLDADPASGDAVTTTAPTNKVKESVKSASQGGKSAPGNGKKDSIPVRPSLADDLIDSYGDTAFLWPDITLQLSHLPKWALSLDHMQHSGINHYCTLRQFAHYYRFVGVSTAVNQALCAYMDGAALARPILFTPDDSLSEITGISLTTATTGAGDAMAGCGDVLVVRGEVRKQVEEMIQHLSITNNNVCSKNASDAVWDSYTKRTFLIPDTLSAQEKARFGALGLPASLAHQWFFSYLLPTLAEAGQVGYAISSPPSPTAVSSSRAITYPATPTPIRAPTADTLSLCGLQFESPVVGLEMPLATGLRKVRVCLSKNSIARHHTPSGKWLTDADSATQVTGAVYPCFTAAVRQFATTLANNTADTHVADMISSSSTSTSSSSSSSSLAPPSCSSSSPLTVPTPLIPVADPVIVAKYYRRPSDAALKSWNIVTGGVMAGEEPPRDWFHVLVSDICSANKSLRCGPFFTAQVLFARILRRVIAVVRGESPVPAVHACYMALRQQYPDNSWVKMTACAYDDGCVVNDTDLVMVFRDLLDDQHMLRNNCGVQRGMEGDVDLDALECQLQGLLARQMHTFSLEVTTAACHFIKVLKTSVLAAVMRYRGMHREETLEDDDLATTLLARIMDLLFRCAFTNVPIDAVVPNYTLRDKKDDPFLLSVYQFAAILSPAEAEAYAGSSTADADVAMDMSRYGMIAAQVYGNIALLHDPSAYMPIHPYLPGLPK